MMIIMMNLKSEAKDYKMTLERLEKYYIVANQLESIKLEYIPSYVSTVDTSKPSIQNSNISDITCDTALERLDINPAIKAEYIRLSTELKELNAFIFSIDDELIRAIAVKRCCLGQSYRNIGRDVHYSGKQCKRIFTKYVSNAS